MSPTSPLKLYLGGVRKHKMHKNYRALTTKAKVTLYNVEIETMLKNKLSEEKRENPVGKTPPQDEH